MAPKPSFKRSSLPLVSCACRGTFGGGYINRTQHSPTRVMPKRNGKSYRDRQYFLSQIGFSSYSAYLKSDLWKRIREDVFARKGRKCAVCYRSASQIHHTNYGKKTLLGLRLKNLHPICGTCHMDAEFKDDRKTTVAQAKRRFFQSKQRAREAWRNRLTPLEIMLGIGRPENLE